MQDNKTHLVEIKACHFNHQERAIFSGLTLSVPRHQVTAIMGPSGTGKTTLLRLIGGQLKPDAGDISINGQSVQRLSKSGLGLLRRNMGLLFQEGGLFTDLTVFENVAFLLREHTDLSEDMIKDLVLLRLEAVGLRGAADLPISALSGGMARRVALARAMMLDPELMMYDEPFTGQDPINRAVLMKLIRELNDAFQLTTVLVSHDVQEVNKIADYVFIIAQGRVIGEGTPAAILTDPSPMIQQFIRGLPDGPVPFQYPAGALRKDLNV